MCISIFIYLQHTRAFRPLSVTAKLVCERCSIFCAAHPPKQIKSFGVRACTHTCIMSQNVSSPNACDVMCVLCVCAACVCVCVCGYASLSAALQLPLPLSPLSPLPSLSLLLSLLPSSSTRIHTLTCIHSSPHVYPPVRTRPAPITQTSNIVYCILIAATEATIPYNITHTSSIPQP